MGTRKFKSQTPGLRGRSILDYEEVSNVKKHKPLVNKLKKNAGRNNTGQITIRRQGGGNKKLYRQIDFKRNKAGVPGTIKSIEYDPNRNAYISLVVYNDGDKRYIILPNKLSVGARIVSGDEADIETGNCLKLRHIPESSVIHNIELTPGKGGQIVRSAGAKAILQAKGKRYASVKLPSGEVRLILLDCQAVLGEVSVSEFRNTKKGKAGANRWIGKRPKVRGAAMNACDHPHGGGEGKAPVGLAGPKTPWGKYTLGKKTRKNKSSRLIVKRRK